MAKATTKKTAKKPAPGQWVNRIVGYGEEAPDQLLANPKNWRLHPQDQQKALSGVLNTVGVVQNVIVNKTTGNMVDGHLRVMLALRENQASVPITYVELTQEEEDLILLTLDPISALAGTDKDLLKDLLETVSTENAGVQNLLDELAAKAGVAGVAAANDNNPDAIPKICAHPVSKEGYVWVLGDHRVACGDGTSTAAVTVLMAGQKADMLHLDPPYEIEGGGDLNPLLESMLMAAGSNCKPGAPWYIWHPLGITAAIYSALASIGKKASSQLIWIRAKLGAAQGGNYRPRHKPCVYLTNEKGAWHGGRVQPTIITTDTEPEYFHPDQMPNEVVERLLVNSTKEGDLVVDIAAGSGVTLIACEKNGRKCYAMDNNPQMVDAIVRRWQQYTGRAATLEATGEPFSDLDAKANP